jgi:hypothetical protein
MHMGNESKTALAKALFNKVTMATANGIKI